MEKMYTKEIREKVNRRLNIINLFISILVFGTGLILFLQFHIGDGAHRKEWLDLEKDFWLVIHQISAFGFLVGFAFHTLLHDKYIKMIMTQWRKNLSLKIRIITYQQILLMIVSLVVICAGFYPWIAMPGVSLNNEEYHDWIDVHNRVGIVFLIGMIVHIQRRWRQIFIKTVRNNINHIHVDTNKCLACWICIDECKSGALGKVDIWFHKHVVIKHTGKCIGCKHCVTVCPNGVIQPVNIREQLNYENFKIE